MNKLRIGIVGCGYWGQNLVRNFSELDEVEVAAICDFDLNALARIKRRHPSVELRQDFHELIADSRIHGIVIATPVSTHYPFARLALLAGKHVLVEKPLATSTAQVLELIELAERKGKILMVDHTFLYTGAVHRMRALVDAGELGDLLYFDSVRISLGLVQSDINVVWDLGPHDFSIMDHLCKQDPVSISATGMRHLGCPFQNIAYVTAHFEGNMIAHFHLNWLAPVKVRRMLVGGSKKMIVYDDMEATEKVKVYDKGISMNHDPEHRERLLAGYRNGDMLAPNLDAAEALRLMAREFAHSIVEQRAPLSDGYSGYRVVRLLEAAQQSIEQNGRPIELRSPVIARDKTLRCMIPPDKKLASTAGLRA
ncbi:MAG: oxidoreductase [Acidobacteriaceae bacterium]|jgi:predicted dehydrogenase|nr:oxidoreductase [Acidobacteriaceae bacterium]